jgi:hypothetical protein
MLMYKEHYEPYEIVVLPHWADMLINAMNAGSFA